MSNKKLTQLKQQRRGYRMNADKQLVAHQAITDDTTLEKRKVLLNKLEYYKDKIESLDSNVLAEIEDDDEMTAEIDESSDYQDKLISAIQELAVYISSVSLYDQKSDNDGESRQSQTTLGKLANKVKLPKLEVPTFGGDPLQWQEFWDDFQSSIHSNPGLATIDKFKYLKSFLKGEALKVVSGYRVTVANYSAVFDVLKDRFDDPEIAIFAHFEKLLALPSGEEQTLKLKDIYDVCEEHIRSLVALGLSEDTSGRVFTPIILSNFPHPVRLQLHRLNGSQKWTLSQLRELMKDEIKAREMSDQYISKSNSKVEKGSSRFTNEKPQQKKNSYWTNQKKPLMPTQSALVNNPKSKLQCSFCSGDHYADKCSKYPTLQERKAVLQNKCFRCLGQGHSIQNCTRKNYCYYCKKTNHHSSLCREQFDKPSQSESTSSKYNAKDTTSGVCNSEVVYSGNQVLMQMAQVNFANENVQARIFFDAGSARSYITTNLSKKLNLPVTGSEVMSVARFGDQRRKTVTYKSTNVEIPTVSDSPVPVSLLILDTITAPLPKYRLSVEKYPILSKVPMADPPSDVTRRVGIDILIGLDHYYQYIGRERVSMDNDVWLVDSKLGYIPTGCMSDMELNEGSEALNVILCQPTDYPVVSNDLERYWSLDDIGIKDDPYQDDDDKALKLFQDIVRVTDGRYEVTWPWKESNPELSTNYKLATGRLTSLLRRIKDQPDVITEYNKIIQDQLKAGVIEQVDPLIPYNNLLYYMPHHCVIRKDKTTTKLRVVYDASAKSSKFQSSLNDCFYRGPVILQDLCGMLIRFRLGKIAVTSDIEKAFLQVGLQQKERDVNRFLWVKDFEKPVIPDNPLTYRFCRVPFGVVSSPFLLAARVKHHLDSQNSNIATDISNNIYVDNVITTRNSCDESITIYHEAKRLFWMISMNIREWYSNSKELMKWTPEKDKGVGTEPKVLGLKWNIINDTLSIPFEKQPIENSVTKREAYKAIPSLYDPCGLFCPVSIKGKLFVQDLWKAKYNWDLELPQGIHDKFKKIINDITTVTDIQIPRLVDGFLVPEGSQTEIHCFCDASAKAYAAAVYIRSIAKGGGISTNLIFSKVRLAPIKSVSIPRLELTAVVIGVRITEFVIKHMRKDIQAVYVWTDSKCVLQWLQSKKMLSVYVRNRVQELKVHHNYNFRYVPTACNPTDLPTKGLTVGALKHENLWWHGPDFLLLRESYWPESGTSDLEYQGKNEVVSETISVLNTSSNTAGIQCIIDINRFSKLIKLLRVSALVLRFVNNCRNSVKQKGFLSKSEIFEAETHWIRDVQSVAFQDEKSLVRHLGVFRDDNKIIRCKGRIQNSSQTMKLFIQSFCPKIPL